MFDKELIESELRKLAARYVDFPHMHVCKHWAAVEVLNLMEVLGLEVSDELVKAVVDADDDMALALLLNFPKKNEKSVDKIQIA